LIKDTKTKSEDKIVFEVTEEGSLGLLATGFVGLEAWRLVRRKARLARKKSSSSKKDKE